MGTADAPDARSAARERAEATAEALAVLGPVAVRPFFGAWELRLGGIQVGMMVSEELYLRVDDRLHEALEDLGGRPFRYRAAGGREIVVERYMSVPEGADLVALVHDAHTALAAGG